MIFVIDIGNTNIVLGLYNQDKLTFHWRLATDLKKTIDEYYLLLNAFFKNQQLKVQNIKKTIISCVVPPIVNTIHCVIQKLTGKAPVFIDEQHYSEINIKIDQPQELGTDRIVNAIAGFNLYQKSLVIIDFGTATTFDIVSEKGDYLGGIITPGLHIALEALCNHTAQLPRVEIEQPQYVIGKNTRHSMQSGIVYGYSGMIDSLIKKISEELGQKPKVIATGGLAVTLQGVSESIEEVVEHLTLWGLNIIFKNNFS